jgi:hypothetical protein
MATFRHGYFDGFFDGTTTYNASTNLKGGVAVPGGGTFSAIQQIGRSGDNFGYYVRVTSAPAFVTTWQLQVAHSGDPSVEGLSPDPDAQAYVWHDAYYINTAVVLTVPSGGGAVMNIVPDFVSGWVRLKRTDANGAVTVMAGWELQGD